MIELNFRNAPPRPPVGPCFVGLGLDGELNDKWTKYKSDNAVEANYAWKLHAEPDLGVPLAPSAMDYEGCYFDPLKAKKQKKNDAYDDLFDDMDEEKEDETAIAPAPLHPDDDALINWKGHSGDTAAEELQRLRDKARAEARLGVKGKSSTSLLSPKQIAISKRTKDFKSRVLDEQNPFFMKKTTYLANDHNHKVHDFKSLAQTKAENEKKITQKLSSKTGSDKILIEQSFVAANTNTIDRRKHPNKDNVFAEYEIPLLPDSETWGHNFIHVVLDSLPNEESIERGITDEDLEKAYIADVNKGENSQRMECNLLLADKDTDDKYTIVQKYDLDVIPLKEEGNPHSNFLFAVDEEAGVATYHPISSRVQLSSGRPTDETGSRHVKKRRLNDEEKEDIEERLAAVDADLAVKFSTNSQVEEELIEQPKSMYPFGGDDSSSDEE